jgi:prolyl 4-hydroxylase
MLLSIAPRIVLVKDALTPEECNDIINSELIFSESIIHGDAPINPAVRSSHTHYDEQNNFGFLKSIATELAEKHSPNNLTYGSENISIQRYEINQEYKQHCDFGDNNNRIATAIFYLNEDFVGGDTFFEKLSITVEPATGSCLIFYYDSDNPTLKNLTSHGGNAVTRGTKYIATAWMKNNEPS